MSDKILEKTRAQFSIERYAREMVMRQDTEAKDIRINLYRVWDGMSYAIGTECLYELGGVPMCARFNDRLTEGQAAVKINMRRDSIRR